MPVHLIYCSYCDHNAYFCELFFFFFFCNDFVMISLFCNLVESWKVLWKLFWSLFLLTWCIWLCPCACMCCSWCVVSVHSCIFLWLSAQCSFLSPSPSVAEGHQMTDVRVYTIKESTRVLGTRGTFSPLSICSTKVCGYELWPCSASGLWHLFHQKVYLWKGLRQQVIGGVCLQ